MASTPYWEHVGVNLQLDPSNGEITSWYTRINVKKIQEIPDLSALIIFNTAKKLF